VITGKIKIPLVSFIVGILNGTSERFHLQLQHAAPEFCSFEVLTSSTLHRKFQTVEHTLVFSG